MGTLRDEDWKNLPSGNAGVRSFRCGKPADFLASAMEAGVTGHVWGLTESVGLLEQGGRSGGMTVAIVLDPAYPELEQLANRMPVWAVDSARHRETTLRLR